MNPNICPQHQQQKTLICQFQRCEQFEGCVDCFKQFNRHYLHQSIPISQAYQQYPQSQLQQQLQISISNFDKQFDDHQQQLLQHLSSIKQQIKNQFSLWLQKSSQDCIFQHSQGMKINVINQLFSGLHNQLSSQYGSQQPIIQDQNFNKYYDKYNIPMQKRVQLEKFKFDKPQFENPNDTPLVEENRANSIIIGQKDPQTLQFNGRAMIIYKNGSQKIYLGYMKNNYRYGYGLMIFDDSQYYLGEYNNNQEWGYGELQMINNQSNEKYVGYFAEGKRTGRGELQTQVMNQSIKNTPCIEYFNNIQSGPCCNSKLEFDLFQNGKSYFDITNIQNSLEVSSSLKNGNSYDASQNSNGNQQQKQQAYQQQNQQNEQNDSNDMVYGDVLYDSDLSNSIQNKFAPKHNQFYQQSPQFQQQNNNQGYFQQQSPPSMQSYSPNQYNQSMNGFKPFQFPQELNKQFGY